MKRIIFLSCFILIANVFKTNSQEIMKDLERPKIGLVLSGGGAKGLAHIGVLKVLEEVGIKPDYITGTSMGSIVGGLYAIGYSATELDSIVRSVDWNEILSDNVNLQNVPYPDKAIYNNYLADININQLREFSLPSGAIQGQKIYETFSSLTWRISDTKSFDDFPIPFRCVATDVITGKPIVFDSGNLVTAMRASMAIPSVFAPVYTDSTVLVDGGVVNNYPVQEVLDMGADIVIGVYVGFPEKVEVKDLKSLTKILSRSVVLTGINGSQEQRELVDIQIDPDLKQYGAQSFNHAGEVVDLGEAAAIPYKEELRALAHKMKNFTIKLEDEKQLPEYEKLYIQDIEVRGTRYISNELVIKRSKIKTEQYHTPASVTKGIQRIYGTQFFNTVNYELKPNDNKTYTLFIDVNEKDRGSIFIGANYDNYYKSSIILQSKIKNVFSQNDYTHNKFRLGENPELYLSYNKYIGRYNHQRLVVDVKMHTSRIATWDYDSIRVQTGSFRFNHLSAGVGIFQSIFLRGEIGVEFRVNTNLLKPKDGQELLTELNSIEARDLSVNGHLRYNSFDKRFFPSKGGYLNAKIHYSMKAREKYDFAKENETNNFSNYYQVIADGKYLIRLNKRMSWGLYGSLGFSQDEAHAGDYFMAGGFGNDRRPNTFNFVGLKPYDIISWNFGVGGANFQLRMWERLYVNAMANYIVYENWFGNQDEYEKMMGYGLSIGYRTPIGPLNITAATSELYSGPVWSFSFGFEF